MSSKATLSKKDILNKVSYTVAILQYLIIIFMFIYAPKPIPSSLFSILLFLFSLNMYLAIVNIIFIKKISLFIIQLLPLAMFTFIETVLHNQHSSLKTLLYFLKNFFSYLIPHPFRVHFFDF